MGGSRRGWLEVGSASKRRSHKGGGFKPTRGVPVGGSCRGCLEVGSASKRRRHEAWGFNPRRVEPSNPIQSPEGAQADRSVFGCLRPFGAFGEEGGVLPGVETPGFMPAPLR